MKDLFIQPITKLLNIQFEKGENLDETLGNILPKIQYMSDNIYDFDSFIDDRWIEVHERPTKDTVLRIFQLPDDSISEMDKPKVIEAPLLYSINGNISNGTWTIIKSDAIILQQDIRKELYDLQFLNEDFMILKKHGERTSERVMNNLLLVKEGVTKKPNEALDILYDIYRYNVANVVFLTLMVLVFLILILLVVL